MSVAVIAGNVGANVRTGNQRGNHSPGSGRRHHAWITRRGRAGVSQRAESTLRVSHHL